MIRNLHKKENNINKSVTHYARNMQNFKEYISFFFKFCVLIGNYKENQTQHKIIRLMDDFGFGNLATMKVN